MKSLKFVPVLIILVGLLVAASASVLLFKNKQSIPSPTPKISEVKRQLKVTLSLNNEKPMELLIPEGSNQCDVLRKAKEDGKIKDLNMKWSENFRTDSVYQINGVGKPDQVWWVFTINDNEVPSGCTAVKVNDGDKVNWKYLGKD